MTNVPSLADASAQSVCSSGGRATKFKGQIVHLAPGVMLLDVRAVADMLGCSTRHVYRLSDAGRMPAPVKLGSLVRWRWSTGDPITGLQEWLNAGCPSVRRATR